MLLLVLFSQWLVLFFLFVTAIITIIIGSIIAINIVVFSIIIFIILLAIMVVLTIIGGCPMAFTRGSALWGEGCVRPTFNFMGT